MAEPKGERARRDEAAGIIEFRVIENDGTKTSLILLTGAKIIFQKQLPKMPKEYITRLVYDRCVTASRPPPFLPPPLPRWRIQVHPYVPCHVTLPARHSGTC